jgi:hypothetical protein
VIGADELLHLVHDGVSAEGAFASAGGAGKRERAGFRFVLVETFLAGQGYFLSGVDEIVRIEVMRVDLVIIPGEPLESMFFRNAGRIQIADAPLAGSAAGIGGRMFGVRMAFDP